MVKGLTVVWLSLLLCLASFCGCGAEGGDRAENPGAGKLSQESSVSQEYPESQESPAPQEQADSQTLPQEPSALLVECGEVSLDALRGTFSWYVEQEDGTGQGVCADSPHPLDMEGQLPQLNGEGKADLRWEGPAPDRVSALCWPDTEWGNYDAESQEVPLEGEGFVLKEGGWIYEIQAEWDSCETWGGQAIYFFYGMG